MDKKIVGLLGAVGALASLNTAQAATSSDPTGVLKAGSYADLLDPIPNAMEKLRAVDDTPSTPKVQPAQLFIEHHHHHDHHYHGYYRGYGPRIRVVLGNADVLAPRPFLWVMNVAAKTAPPKHTNAKPSAIAKAVRVS